MQCKKCHCSIRRSMSLLPDHVKETGALRPVELLRAVDTSDQIGLAKREGEPNAAAVADEAREPAARFLTRWLDLRLGLGVVSRGRGRRAGSHARVPSVDWLAALRPTNLSPVNRGCQPPAQAEPGTSPPCPTIEDLWTYPIEQRPTTSRRQRCRRRVVKKT